jgi:hypothetical protein
LNDPERAVMPDVLCASQVLQLFEVSGISNHASGVKPQYTLRTDLEQASRLLT